MLPKQNKYNQLKLLLLVKKDLLDYFSPHIYFLKPTKYHNHFLGSKYKKYLFSFIVNFSTHQEKKKTKFV